MCVVTLLSPGDPCITLKPTLSTNFSSHLVVPGVTVVQTERQTNNLINLLVHVGNNVLKK